ncbi:hypothetical protein PFMALIP_04503 [Plasmodium falciparum MaliPS096_E11]|uniref:Uncharacterized protein n=1 Tax=Plasmodium falciparum MaliPS096_E11 TaxID=1036727 RepID=A0A024WJN1_PLAFA|nr:hypothetical protein PFMALIP_04503 [Plasmodium falciparum MaliPS096_E11]
MLHRITHWYYMCTYNMDPTGYHKLCKRLRSS